MSFASISDLKLLEEDKLEVLDRLRERLGDAKIEKAVVGLLHYRDRHLDSSCLGIDLEGWDLLPRLLL